MKTVLTRRRPRVLVAVGCLLAALVVALLPVPPGVTPAAAADGAESSAVTKPGTKGKYDDFSDLEVTVHQTAGLRSQAVRVTWEGGAQTQPGNGRFNVNYLQIMQCWGDDPQGPDREQCVYGGSAAVVADGQGRVLNDSRDPDENGGSFVPFRPANRQPATTSAYDFTYFGPLDTNEQQANTTFANGTGETMFEVQDGVQADYLGCGVNTAPAGGTPVPRRCWLVVVPRGHHDADGREITQPTSDGLGTSPLSATNWAQRIVFPLDFLQVDQFCPDGQPERPMTGSELLTDAVTSWQPKLCTSTKNTFGFTSAGEEQARNEVLNASPETPTLGFTVEPVRKTEGGAAVLHAPVAVSGLAFAFFIEGPDGAVQDLNLTPRLVAKLLTHSYQQDVALAPTPEHIKDNPVNYSKDPEFNELNPDFPAIWNPMSLMVPIGNSDTARVVWNWLQSDKEAREFLAGEPDPHGMKVNPYFQELGLDENTALNEYPKVDPTRGDALQNSQSDPLSHTLLDLAPYTSDLHDGAVRTRRGNNQRTIMYAAPNNGVPAKLVNDAPWPGSRAVMSIVDVPSAERYGLPVAALRNAGGEFVKPTTGSLLAGVDTMRPSAADSGVLAPDPARAKGRAYPLTAVTYAAASVNQDAAARKAYAEFIRYAVGPGQKPGPSAGELPPGYAPLPAKLRTRAETAADGLERGVTSQDPPPGGSDPQDPGGANSGLTGGTGGDSAGATGGGAASGAGGATGGTTDPEATEPAATNGSAPPSAGPQQNVAEAKSGITPGDVMGVIRWILVAVLILGGAAGLSGPVMLRLAHRRIP